MRIIKLSLIILFIILGCSKDKDDNLIELNDDLEISDFVWKGLNEFYYWQTKVPNLDDSKIENTNIYTQFISQNSTTSLYFGIFGIDFDFPML